MQRRNRLVIIPAFNEAGCIVDTIEDIRQNAPSFDYVVINDCSRDDTGELCEKYHYNVVNLPINSGIGAAVQTGYMYAKRYGYEYAIQVDGDGQHDASFLEEMADIMEDSDINMLIGSRFIKKEGFQSSNLRRLGIKYFTFLIKVLTGKVVTDPTSGMRMVDREVIKIFADDYPKDYPEPETAVSIIKRGLKIKEIPVRMKERQAGVSSISFKRSIYYMIKVSLACVMAAFGVK
ncbi:MAG: glycosyltransferase family 2 protein [Lachnospiraceae bacterium]|nr:glycosyltransferase family 2 protein [Lachnospiraceae bacterium]